MNEADQDALTLVMEAAKGIARAEQEYNQVAATISQLQNELTMLENGIIPALRKELTDKETLLTVLKNRAETGRELLKQTAENWKHATTAN